MIIQQIRKLLGIPSKAPAALPYRQRDDFLSSAELSYYKILTSVLGPKGTVLAKVRLADILFVPHLRENMRFFNRIAQRHVDFVLCESSDMRPVLVIELDDASHERSSRKERDSFLDEALRAAGVPILRVKPRRQYVRDDVIAELRPYLAERKEREESPSSEDRLPEQEAASPQSGARAPICPNCGGQMVLRVASQGRHKGRRFYGCSNYPKCRQVLPVDSGEVAG